MRSKKVIALLISLTLLVSSVLPGTLAVSIDQDAASSSVTLTSGEQETPTPAPEEQQEQEGQNEQENNCTTCGGTDGTHGEDCPLYEAPKTLMTASAQTAGNGNYAEGHVPGKIRIKINVKLVDADGNVTNAPAGVPVEVRRLLSNAYATKGWKDQLVLFTGTSDENGVVYIEQPYTYVQDTTNVQNDTVYLGDGSSNDFDHVVFQRVDNNLGGIRFSIAPAENSGYTLVAGGNGSAVKCTSNSNGGLMTRQDGAFSVDDFVFHDGLGDDDNQPNNNGGAYIVFDLYVQEKTADIQYNIVGSENGGTLSSTGETLKAFSGLASGSSPTANTGYQFVGWYKDEACTQPVDTSWVNPTTNQLIPQKENLGSSGDGYKAATYYAKFTPVPGTYELKLQVKDTTSDKNQSFLFDVTGPDGFHKRVVINGNGSVTINGLKIGTYTVTEVTGWSWRYKPENNDQTITLQPAKKNEVTFENTRSSIKWLDGNAYCKNEFKNN